MSLLEKYKACIVLHALGDTIGFKNGDWEFNNGLDNANYSYSDDILYEFISLGGILDIDLEGWIVSDDTILHMATIESLITNHNNIDEFMAILVKKYIKAFDNMINRLPGKGTIKSIEKLDKGLFWKKVPYEFISSGSGGGSGASMRMTCIGLVFHGENNRDKLIEYSIEASRVTHNGVFGYLGGFSCALLTAFCLENVKLELWPFKLVEFLESGRIDDYLKKTRGYKEYKEEKELFISYWRKYIELNYLGKIYSIKPSTRIPSVRSQHYIKYYTLMDDTLPGFMGHDSVIIAFDALISARDKWESLVVYSMLHVGDSDTTGCIAAGWYGALYGFKNIPENNLKHLEYKDKLENLSEKLYSKYQ